MKLRSNLKFRHELMLVVPMFDVIGTLLIFFLLGSSLVFPSGVRVELPPSSFALQGLADAHVLVVSAGSEPKLLLNDNDVPLSDLGNRLDGLATADRQRLGRVGALVIKADRTTPHGMMNHIKNTALTRGFRVAEVAQPGEGD